MPSVEELRAALTSAMKERDAIATTTLRMALAAIANAEVAGKEKRTLSEDEIAAVLVRELKRREEASEAFTSAGRDDRAQQELAERDVLAKFLPAPLSREEIERIVDEVVTAGANAMGPAMREVMGRVGSRADGKVVSEIVRSRLGG